MRAARTLRLVAVALAQSALAGIARPAPATPTPEVEPAEPVAELLHRGTVGVLLLGVAGRSTWRRPRLVGLGARTVGIRNTTGGDGQARWDAQLAAATGTVSAETPAPRMIGWLGRAEGDLGWRPAGGPGWRPYLGAHGRVRLEELHARCAVVAAGTPAESRRRREGALRLEVGLSSLARGRALRLSAFLQGARRPVDPTGEATFAELGLAARIDVVDRLSASLEASRGWSVPRRDRALGFTDRTTHDALEAALRLELWRTAWIELEGRAYRDADRMSYAAGRTYGTVGAPQGEAGLAIGAWLGRW